ncbi:MAG: ATP-binding cassette domain-containing protein [Acidobacteria bacterium]|nr:MAG: ATP-binding cassette domain-containing protein [Acidobacteriota bacterium]REK11074.1 MAG: ATP-binding cassette domain-containing protein [Acidobacteriota bacterium]
MIFDCEIELPLRQFTVHWRLHGEVAALGVYGPSGAGKTSLLETLAGWRRPSRGRIVLGGRTLFDSRAGIDLPPRQRRIGYLPQDVLLFPHLTARGNVELARAAGRDADARVDVQGDFDRRLGELAELLEIDALLERRPGELSGGERQRVGLARALCAAPDLLLLDEPLTALDPPLKRRILSDLLSLRERFPVPLILVSHDPLLALVLCERVQRLERGRIVAEGPSGARSRAASEAHEAETAVPSGGPAPSDVDAAHRADREPPMLTSDNLVQGVVTAADDDVVRLDCQGLEIVVPQSSLPATRSAGAASERAIAVGDRVTATIGSEEILVATREPELLSAVNVIATDLVERLGADSQTREADPDAAEAASSEPATVDDDPPPLRARSPGERVSHDRPAAERPSGVVLRCREPGSGLELVAHVTAGTAVRLDLVPGKRVWLVFKAHAVEVVAVVGPGRS